MNCSRRSGLRISYYGQLAEHSFGQINDYYTFSDDGAPSLLLRALGNVTEADLDGDGVVYYVGDRAGLEEHPVDNDVYEAWRDQYLAGAQVLPVWYYPLTEENISLIG